MNTIVKFSLLLATVSLIATSQSYASEKNESKKANSYEKSIKSFRHGQVFKTRTTVLK